MELIDIWIATIDTGERYVAVGPADESPDVVLFVADMPLGEVFKTIYNDWHCGINMVGICPPDMLGIEEG